MYYEKYEIGQVFDLPPVKLSEEDIIEFGKKYDPRPIHVNKEDAEVSMFGGIIASGFQTILIGYNEWVKSKIDKEGLIVGTKVNYALWLKPLYPDQIIKSSVEVTDKKIKDGQDKGFVTLKLIMKNEKDEIILDMGWETLVRANK